MAGSGRGVQPRDPIYRTIRAVSGAETTIEDLHTCAKARLDRPVNKGTSLGSGTSKHCQKRQNPLPQSGSGVHNIFIPPDTTVRPIPSDAELDRLECPVVRLLLSVSVWGQVPQKCQKCPFFPLWGPPCPPYGELGGRTVSVRVRGPDHVCVPIFNPLAP